jgi:hypothetical protein
MMLTAQYLGFLITDYLIILISGPFDSSMPPSLPLICFPHLETWPTASLPPSASGTCYVVAEQHYTIVCKNPQLALNRKLSFNHSQSSLDWRLLLLQTKLSPVGVMSIQSQTIPSRGAPRSADWIQGEI